MQADAPPGSPRKVPGKTIRYRENSAQHKKCEAVRSVQELFPVRHRALPGLSENSNPLSKHLGMIAQLTATYGTSLSEEKAGDVITDYINTTCEKILDCTAVFKSDEKGQEAFDKFINSVIG